MTGITSTERDEVKRQLGDRVRQLIDSEEKARAAVRGMINDFDRSALAADLK